MKNNYLSVAFVLALIFATNINSFSQIGPAIKWQKCLGGTKEDKANDVALLPDGGFLIVGYSKSNDGTVSGHHGSTDSTDGWIAKIDTSGNIVWQKSIGGSGIDLFTSIIATKDNNYLCLGQTSSNDGDVTGNHGLLDFWAVKITATGVILWSKCYGGSAYETLADGVLTSDGGFALIGSVASKDGDVSGFHEANGSSDIWVLKINASGNIIWQKCYGDTGGGGEWGNDIIEDADHQLVASVHNSGSYSTGDDFPLDGYYYEYVIKIDKDNGNFIYKTPIFVRSARNAVLSARSTGYFESIGIAISAPACLNLTSATYMQTSAGTTLNQIINPGVCPGSYGGYAAAFAAAHGLATLTDSSFIGAGNVIDAGAGYGSNEACIETGKFLSGGNKYYLKKYGGSGADAFTSIKILPSGNDFIAVGSTSSNDFDVSGNHGGGDCWVVRLSGTNRITGNVFQDNNGNGIKDAGEPVFDRGLVKSEKTGFKQYAEPYVGFYQNDLDTGFFTTSFVPNKPYFTVTPSLKTSVFSNYKNYDTINFAVQPMAGKKDYSLVTTAGYFARPGNPLSYRIVYSNSGTDTLVNKSVIFIKDKRTFFRNGFPDNYVVSGDTVSWNISSLFPGNTGIITVNVKLDSIPRLHIGDTLITKTYIDSSGDVMPADNTNLLRQIIRGSFDPNDKVESNEGVITTADVSSGKKLYYTIHFQNTGSDTAFNITVRDTLDAKTDWSSIQMEDASHAYQFNIKEGKYCTWQFNNINLVDSVHNEPLSHGYITYGIKPAGKLAVGDTIRNQASIYFDFNPGVKTNTQVTIVKQYVPPPPIPTIAGLKNSYCNTVGIQKIVISNLPSAGSGISAAVKLDNNPISITADSSFTVNPSLLAAGTHIVTVAFVNITDTKTATSNFIVNQAAVPDVDLTSNISTVINLADPVIITAINAAGGGTSPLYTFAKDKALTNILQAESNNNKLSIQPNTLTVGTNRIYVRMRTSDTCYTNQANTDSISIDRSAITGLTDIDFPGQLINVYPNPFVNAVNITGLNAAKAYTVTISNARGQRLFTRQLSATRSVSINEAGLPKGNYWLALYDDKKHSLIGTVSLIKQ